MKNIRSNKREGRLRRGRNRQISLAMLCWLREVISSSTRVSSRRDSLSDRHFDADWRI